MSQIIGNSIAGWTYCSCQIINQTSRHHISGPLWWAVLFSRLYFYQTRLAWSVDQGSNKNHSPAYNFAPTVTKFCVMWEGLSLPHDTKFGNCRCKTVVSRAFPSWSLIHGLRWSGLIKAKPGHVWVIAAIHSGRWVSLESVSPWLRCQIGLLQSHGHKHFKWDCQLCHWLTTTYQITQL